MTVMARRPLGAVPSGDGSTHFRLWAPNASAVELVLTAPRDETIRMSPAGRGYFETTVEGVGDGARYAYRLDGGEPRPDPASRYQPEGVHGASQVVDPSRFAWQLDAWDTPPLDDYVIYELHVGAFTPEGTFEAVIDHLDHLRGIGINAIEIMPVAQFPGDRNWGYDGVSLFAVQNSYGGPHGLRRLVDACHARGMAVVLDVVHNHLGPEGNYLSLFGPYFTDKYRTPWGSAVNFDGAGSDEVREFFIQSTLHWLDEYRIDAFRLDAVHAILDQSAYHFLAELRDAVHRYGEDRGRRVYVISESDLNDPRVIYPAAAGGFAHDGQWSDDIHHAIHGLLTGEREGYYEDFGSVLDLAQAYRLGYVFSGQHSPHRRRRHGAPPTLATPRQFVVCSQNHDQVGNRARGERLTSLVDYERLKLAAAAVILSPFTPLLFMGEEYGEPAPFQYFTSHSDPDLVEAVRRGRREEFSAFAWRGEIPDPQDPATFARSKLDHRLRSKEPHRTLERLYGRLIRLRRERPSLARPRFAHLEATANEADQTVTVRRWRDGDETVLILHFGGEDRAVEIPVPRGDWQVELDTGDTTWRGRREPAPRPLPSPGMLTLRIGAHSAILLRRLSGED